MKVTATEFKTNMGKYLDLVSQTDIYITMNGKVIATLT
ncbi:type II toxin-antitoxin system prevent-host-death family antitoxin [Galactobacillus timonensis]|nr:type II toxin-antitoxin system prevent-host-death family antitoxin [Galactobacillus timonensis]